MPNSSTIASANGSQRSFAISWFVFSLVTAICIIFFVYHESLAFMANKWLNNENYGHGLFVPFIALYIMWLKKDRLRDYYGHGSWLGLIVVLLGIGLYMVGQLSTLFVIQHISLWITIVGLALTVLGIAGTKIMAFPLGLLFVIIPLPTFLFQGLTTNLRLISSTLGVGCLQIVGITAFQNGNVIDLGPIQLQVVEACSGLRFLFPLMTLALLCAYFLKEQLWKRIFLFLSSIPIAIFLNGFRIGVIGMLVEIWGRGAAYGFLHLFEGWVVFLLGLALLVGEMWLMTRLWPLKQQDQPLSSDGISSLVDKTHHRVPSRIPWKFVSSLAILLVLGSFSNHLEAREEHILPRRTFLDFPLTLGSWEGTALTLEQIYIDALRFDDYFLANYQKPEDIQDAPVNFYVAYYQSQRAGQSIHSPKSCIPGGGWLIDSTTTIPIHISDSSTPLMVNAVTIKKENVQQLVFYWFQQRGRNLTNEYLVKWYLLWDTLTQQRTDGALVRLTTSIEPRGDLTKAKNRLSEFAQLALLNLRPYIPE